VTQPAVAKTLRVVIADDEPLARQRLEDLLAKEEHVEIVATPSNGDETVEAIRELKPDLVFLDVQMPGQTGVEVVRTIGPDEMPTTIFVTAFNHHALSAFELAAIDYLVKPFDDERFEQAFRRARRAIELEEVSALRSKLLAVLQGEEASAAAPPAEPASPHLERITVESKGKVNFVRVAEIDYIVSSGPYAELHVGDKTYLIRESMQNLEAQLDPAEFIRIHRSIIVRTALVDTLHKAGGGDYEVQLKGGARLKVSRTRREELERRFGKKA
jgi:two-component system LytT family response regulator